MSYAARYNGARVTSQRCPILHYSSRIIYKHVVAFKALNLNNLYKIHVIDLSTFLELNRNLSIDYSYPSLYYNI
jgi:hypothetical protein